MHVFVDESERPNAYLLGAALVADPGELGRLRTGLADLRRPGQRRFHFAKESEGRRRALLAALVSTGIRARVYSCPDATGEARIACLTVEPLLWVADAVTWAVGAGGDWRRRVAPMLDEHVRVGR
jgi:hypothetical protein